jgi:beta-glucosidase
MGSARLWLDEQLLIEAVEPHPIRVDGSPPLRLEGGQPHDIQIEFASTAHTNALEPGDVQLGWTHPAEAHSPAMHKAITLARESDVAIVFARIFESEQRDRASLTLPNDQDQLIHAVAAANPWTVVVLGCGGPVTMPWVDQVPAVVNAYYAGQEQGAAVADILFGDINPSGKLPLTFPRSEAQVPVANPCQRAAELTTTYSEGIFVGYRAYDQNGLEPLFPFGHGLSYTSFSYAHLQLTPETANGTEEIRVSFEVTNSGERAGTEIAQVYLGRPARVAAPPKQLAGWVRVLLEPGESKQVTITVNPQAVERPLSWWNANTHGWEIAPGGYPIYVSASSRDIRLNGVLHIVTSSSNGKGDI